MIAVLIATAIMIAPWRAAHSEHSYLEDFGNVSALEPSSWSAFFRARQVRLEPERRLANGISWRLFRDIQTGLAWPRITWMPDRARMLIANDMLEQAHGRALIRWELARRSLLETNEDRRRLGWSPYELPEPVVQTGIDLAYASRTLVSVVDLEAERSEGSDLRAIRGLTFDLSRREVYRVTPCASPQEAGDGAAVPHGLSLGMLLQVCSDDSLKQFFQLAARQTKLAIQRANARDFGHAANCLHQYVGEFAHDLGAGDNVVLYLTFSGLAVHRTEFVSEAGKFECALYRTPLNPVIIPYRELEPFMKPGPWRDELLALH